MQLELEEIVPDNPVALGLSVIVVYVLYQLLRPSKLPKLPIVGAKPGEWFALRRARWRNTRYMKNATETAYNQYSDCACILPIAGAQTFVHLPHKELRWLLEQPDSVINNLTQVVDSLQLHRTLMDPDLAYKPGHISVISGPLTREIGNLVPTLLDEIQYAVDDLWGMDTESYQDTSVFTSMCRVIGQTTNRVFISLPLCREPALLDSAMAFSLDIPTSSIMLHHFWPSLRPLLAPFITLPNCIHTSRFFKIVRPEIRRRLRDYDTIKAEKKQPNDFLHWSIDHAKSMGDPYYGQVDTLAGRVLLNNFTSIHTSSFAITYVIFDLVSSKSSTQRASQHHQEPFPRVGPWFAVLHILHDATFYPEPETFKPFRFADNRAKLAKKGESYVQQARQALTTTSPEFAAFGHGRHACVGMFFAASMLKLMLGYILMNYDFEFEEKRAENPWFGANRIPPIQATIRVKRRAEK
ncbi:hypothetical protein G7Y89_g15403 [Cudoniella acicularis]|uniref:Cytochrome P450 n=1 Tax=Cudoniella acicularis TaxID=354080 RepID=A0A8H4QNQ7_9HELO|nr:hypothetical protein G7Y89_g15403 [Cudoniella acicularis]